MKNKKQWKKPNLTTITAQEIAKHIKVAAWSPYGGGCAGLMR